MTCTPNNTPPTSCQQFATEEIEVLPTPEAMASNDGGACVGADVQLSAETVAGATYSWTGPGTFISGDQNPMLTNVVLADAGVYTLTVELNGCSSTSDISNIKDTKVFGTNPAHSLSLDLLAMLCFYVFLSFLFENTSC